MAKYQFSWKCPRCGAELELRMRVTLKERYCSVCRYPITPAEIDRQEEEKARKDAERYLDAEAERLRRDLDDEAERLKFAAEAQRRNNRFARTAFFFALIMLAALAVIGGVSTALVVIVALASKPATVRQPSAVIADAKVPKKDSMGIQSDGNLVERPTKETGDRIAEQKRNQEEIQKAKAQAEAKAKTEAETQKAKEQAVAKAKIEAERLELEMVLYELAAAEFFASNHVSVARQLLDEAKGDEKIVNKARERLFRVIDDYPDTVASREAKQILDGKFVSIPSSTQKSALPKGVTAKEDEVAVTVRPSTAKLRPDPNLPSIPISGVSPKPVYVRGYTRPDGVLVEPHYRMVSRKE